MLVTLDKDFGELVFRGDKSHVGIIRLVGFRARQQGRVSLDLLGRYDRELAAGAVITAEPWRVRIRERELGLRKEQG